MHTDLTPSLPRIDPLLYRTIRLGSEKALGCFARTIRSNGKPFSFYRYSVKSLTILGRASIPSNSDLSTIFSACTKVTSLSIDMFFQNCDYGSLMDPIRPRKLVLQTPNRFSPRSHAVTFSLGAWEFVTHLTLLTDLEKVDLISDVFKAFKNLTHSSFWASALTFLRDFVTINEMLGDIAKFLPKRMQVCVVHAAYDEIPNSWFLDPADARIVLCKWDYGPAGYLDDRMIIMRSSAINALYERDLTAADAIWEQAEKIVEMQLQWQGKK